MKLLLHYLHRVKILLAAVVLLFCYGQAQAQNISGKEFWFTFPYVDVLAGEGPTFFMISDYCIDSGIVEIPGLNWKVYFDIVPGQYTSIAIPELIAGQAFYHNQVNKKDRKGIRIYAPFPITVYAVTYNQASVDGETVLPTTMLGTDYVGAIRGGMVQGMVRMTAVATEDSTNVVFRYWNPATGLPKKDSIFINRGETWQVTTSRQVCNADFIGGIYASCGAMDGALVKANKPIALVGSLDCACSGECGACDNLMTMPMPISEWGTSYALAQAIRRQDPAGGVSCLPANTNSGDWYQIIGKVGTTVTINDLSGTTNKVIPNVPWNNGANYGYGYLWGQNPKGTGVGNTNFGDCNMIITATDPIQVLQYSKGWQTDNQNFTDPEALYIYPEKSWKSSYLIGTLRVNTTANSYITIVLNDVGTPLPSTTITQNGMNVGTLGWTQIGTSTYKYKRIDMVPTSATLRMESTSGYKFGIYSASSGAAESFSFQGGQGPILTSICPTCPIADFSPSKKTVCIGETVTFNDKSKDNDATGLSTIVRWVWSYGDGTADTLTTKTNPTHIYTAKGIYTVKLTITNNSTPECSQEYTQVVVVSDGPTVDPGKDTSICKGKSVTLGGNPTVKGGLKPYTIKWTGSGLNKDTAANPVATPGSTTTYEIAVSDSAKCSIKKTVTVTVHPIDSIYLTSPGTICLGEKYNLQFNCTNKDSAFTVLLSNGSTTTTLTNVKHNTKYEVSPTTTTEYQITGFTGSTGCQVFSTAKIKVTVRPLPTADFLTATGTICYGDTFPLQVTCGPATSPPSQFNFTYSDGTSSYTVSNPALPYTIKVNPTATTTYTLTNVEYTTNPKCSGNPARSATVTVVPRSNAGIGDTITLCKNGNALDLFDLLTGNPQPNGTWTDLNNSGGLTISIFDPKKNPGLKAGSYRFKYTVKGTAPCPESTAQVMINIVTPPAFSNITDKDNCSADLKTYKVKAEVSGGDPLTYVSPEGSIALTGGKYIFTSTQSYATKTNYTITVDDANKCGPSKYSGYVNCGCKTSAGKMNQPRQERCETEAAVFQNATESNLLSGDTLIYILHEGTDQQIINEKARSSTPQFSFNPATMQYGVTYYVSSAAGPSAGTGPNFAHECISVAKGAEVRWFKQVTAILSGNNAICAGTSSNLQVAFTGAAPFSAVINGQAYSNLPANASLPVSPGTTTVYTLDTIGDYYCTNGGNGQNVTIAVNNPPVKVAGSEQFSCNGLATEYVYSFDITGGDPSTYQVLTAGAGSISGNTFTSVPVPSGEMFQVDIDDNNQCGPLKESATYTCPCNTAIGSLTPTTQSVCEGLPIIVNSVSLTNDGDDEVLYVLHADPAKPLLNPITISRDTVFAFKDSVMDFGTPYYVTAIAASKQGSAIDFQDRCIVYSNTVSATVNQNPLTSITGISPICNSQTSTLTFTIPGPNTYKIEFNAGTNPAPESPATVSSANRTVVVSPASTTQYTVTKITDMATGCSSLPGGTFTVVVNNAPTAAMSAIKNEICQKDQAALQITTTGIPPFSYTVQSTGYSQTFTNIFENQSSVMVPANIGMNTYSISGFSDKGCPGNPPTPVQIEMHADPTATVSSPASICDGNPLDLTFSFNGSGPFNANYTANGLPMMLQGVKDGHQENVSYRTGVNNFQVNYVLDLATGCYNNNQGTSMTDVHDLPSAMISGITDICAGDSIPLNIKLTGAGPITVVVTDNSTPPNQRTYTGTAGGGTPFYMTPPAPGDYVYSIVSVNDINCPGTSTGTAMISAKDAPQASFTLADNKGCAPVVAVFNNTSLLSNPKECLWDLGDGTILKNCANFTHIYDNIGAYNVNLRITSETGCTDDTTVLQQIVVYPDPFANFSFTPSEPSTSDNIVNFQNLSENASRYKWRIGNLQTTESAHPQVVFPSDRDGVYVIELKALTDYGCSDSITKILKVKGDLLSYIPNSFTPNGDGTNDYFMPVLEGNRDDIKSYDLYVFNRWGEVIFHTNNPDVGWDGKYKGIMQPNGIYPYRIIIKSRFDAYAKEKTGGVSLVH